MIVRKYLKKTIDTVFSSDRGDWHVDYPTRCRSGRSRTCEEIDEALHLDLPYSGRRSDRHFRNRPTELGFETGSRPREIFSQEASVKLETRSDFAGTPSTIGISKEGRHARGYATYVFIKTRIVITGGAATLTKDWKTYMSVQDPGTIFVEIGNVYSASRPTPVRCYPLLRTSVMRVLDELVLSINIAHFLSETETRLRCILEGWQGKQTV
ncbi:hypothetical protein DFH11DRAFT_1545249 [Phellopilus nigrolimitatus]|nr:hypothetical protein DFH11DRAFT_1545249 [Phellopilus nigrolimitatus]